MTDRPSDRPPIDARWLAYTLLVVGVLWLADIAVRSGAALEKLLWYGDRLGTLTDPFGHVWHIATHKEDVSMEEMERRAKAAHGGGQ